VVNLLDTLVVKGLPLENRLVLPPMQTSLATSQGEVTKNLINYYVQRSTGPGLIIVEHSYITLQGRVSDKQLGIYDDSLIQGLKTLSSQVHRTGTPIVIQINHGGQKTSSDVTGFQPVAPSPTSSARELTGDELAILVDQYAAATVRAIKAGFDGVEVHGAHGFLLNQFYSPLANHRTDSYGGSLENQMRLPLKIVQKVRQILGNRLLLYRLGVVDMDSNGIHIDDSQLFARKLVDAGVDVIDVSGGLCGSRPTQLEKTQGFFIPQAHAIKRSVNVPVIGVGGIRDPEYANRLIMENIVDLVAVGRPMMNNANWATHFLNNLHI
jgi:NADPH2 dehydrogenase